MRGSCIVKLGGSLAGPLAGPDELTAWLDTLIAAEAPMVLVAGGGPFADQVREAQTQLGFDDRTAHHLAILAMEQFGRALAGLRPALQPADSKSAIETALRQGQLPVWMPARMTIGRAEIPESWEVTSDSLALWLAGQLGARRVFLVKSAPTPEGPLTAEGLAAAGFVDAAFPGFFAAYDGAVSCVCPGEQRSVSEAFRRGGLPGKAISGG